jgi:hypothetical protein
VIRIKNHKTPIQTTSQTNHRLWVKMFAKQAANDWVEEGKNSQKRD